MAIAPKFDGSEVNSSPVPYEAITAAGAISITNGVVSINGTTLAVSLPAPATDIDGQELTVITENASAHVLTITGGTFNGGANNTGTYGAAVANLVVLVAIGGEWWVKLNTNVTLSAV